jgi:hypothetical protein
MARLAKFMEDSASAKMNPSALRGLMAFAAASGPHRAMALIDNFCPAGKATPRLMEVLQDCDYARKLVQDMKPVDYRGVETAWASDTRLNSLHNLWNGLAARSPENRPYVGNVNGAIGELKALRRFGKKIQHISPESLGPTILSRTVKLQDFLFTPTHAIEVKSEMSGKKLWGRIQDIKFQLDRWVAMNNARRAHNIAINSSELHQPIIKQLTYVIVIPQNSTGERAKLIERELREHVETLLKDPDAWGDVDVVPDINFEVIRLDELT